MKERKRIEYGEAVEVSFSPRDVDLIREDTFADPEYVQRLRSAPGTEGRLLGKFTLDDLDDLLGYVAAEANHAKSKKLQRELDALYGRLKQVMASYDDGG